MRYHRDPEVFFRSNRRTQTRGKWWLLVVVLVLILFGSPLVQGLSSPVLAITYPVFKITGQLQSNFNDVKSFLAGERRLVTELGEVTREKNKLAEEVVVLREQVKTYAELVNAVSTTTLGAFRPARVLSRPNRSPYDTLIIEGGEKSNSPLAPQTLVFSEGGVVLGEIDQVYGGVSRVVLFSTPGKKLTVEIGEEHVQAEAEGLGSGNFKIVLPRGVDIKVGDSIISPSLSDEILGVVGLVDVKPENPFQTIYFKSPINVYELVWVFIRKN